MLLEQQELRVVREPFIAEKVVFVGGHPGCGKTMMTPIVGSLARVEVQKFNYMLEHICSLYLLGKIPEDAATAVLRMLVDMDLYNLQMSRETNFRFSDLSSVFKNPGTWRYIRRLFQPGDAAVIGRIQKEKPILQITTHDSLVLSPPLFKALDERLRVVEVIRHPLHMIKQWYLYIDRYGNDVRDFTIWFQHDGHALPYFARGWEEKYLRANTMDKLIYSIDHLTALGQQVIQNLAQKEKRQVMIIPFERFVLEPWPFLRQLESFLGTEVTRSTRRELKRQHVPRKMIADGIPRPIYKQYGWEPPGKERDERRELEKRREFAAERATPEAMKVLDRMCSEYEAAYLTGILK